MKNIFVLMCVLLGVGWELCVRFLLLIIAALLLFDCHFVPVVLLLKDLYCQSVHALLLL